MKPFERLVKDGRKGLDVSQSAILSAYSGKVAPYRHRSRIIELLDTVGSKAERK